jgi:GNAT superfamily N-acetyltransferase
MPKIRLATAADIPEVCRIIGLLSPPDKPHNYTDAVIKFNTHILSSPDYFLWVAEVDNLVAGTAMMHLQHKLSYECGTAAHLEDVVIDLPYRKQGLGELLLAEAIKTAKEYNAYKLMLTCYAKTAVYYEKFGFVQHDIGMRLSLK